MNINNTLHIYPCIKIVKGVKRSALYDLQRCRIYTIPNSFSDLLDNGVFDVDHALLMYPQSSSIVYQYASFLIDNELARRCTPDTIFQEIEEQLYSPYLITHAILDYDKTMSYSLEEAINELSHMRCEGLKIRFFDIFPVEFLKKTFNLLHETSIRGAEFIIQFDEKECDYRDLSILIDDNPRIQSIIISNTPSNYICNINNLSHKLVFTHDSIISPDNCGIFDSSFLRPIQEFYQLSLNHNNCLYGLISINRNGYICNCPSINRTFGHYKNTNLKAVIENNQFLELWNITKDKIDTCKKCELRYACQDCRAFIADDKIGFAKPHKCHYLPNK